MVDGIENKASALLQTAITRGIRIATAESCTGGMVSSALTAVPGSSDVFDRGFITYSNQAKQEMLGVPQSLLITHGAVSREVALAMAEGALHRSHAELSVAITGIAGPGGGTQEKPVGLVHIACAWRRNGKTAHLHQECHFTGDRDEIRSSAAETAIDLLLRCVNTGLEPTVR